MGTEGLRNSQDPKSYVEALLEVHRKNSAVVEESFRGEQGFRAALDKASAQVVGVLIVERAS